MPINFRIHNTALSVCQLKEGAEVPADILAQPFSAFLRTKNEVTLICPTSQAPLIEKREDGWCALELVGPFDFSLTGILVQVAAPLATAGISIFALSTYDTDYVLIKSSRSNDAIRTLKAAGHTLTP